MNHAPLVQGEPVSDVRLAMPGFSIEWPVPQGGSTGMTEVDKLKILQILRDRGLHARAEWVDRQLPERVDLDKNAGLLATLHISRAELTDTQP
jgi:hypothetical protein